MAACDTHLIGNPGSSKQFQSTTFQLKNIDTFIVARVQHKVHLYIQGIYYLTTFGTLCDIISTTKVHRFLFLFLMLFLWEFFEASGNFTQIDSSSGISLTGKIPRPGALPVIKHEAL